jgi:pyruvate dehydrogenase E1 component alpha subunit
MLLIRRFEEKAAELYSAGKIRGFLHLSIGEEAVSVAAIGALSAADNVVSTYREHGHALARGVPPGPVMAELFGKSNGASRGRGGSMHIFDVSRRFYGGNAIVGGGLPLAVGLALADRLRHRDAITTCLFGDGAVAEGEFHESLNLASLWQLPVLFICENNYYAMGTALERHQAETDISLKGAAYRIPSAAVDGMDVVATAAAARAAVDQVRSSGAPFLLECRTYRFRAHSMYDPELYRSKDEVEQWKQRDPIPLFRAQVEKDGTLTGAEMDALDRDAQEATRLAVTFAEAGEWEPVADLLRDVYAGEPACA